MHPDFAKYKAPPFLWNGHMDTIYPYLFRKLSDQYQRERMELPDGDFLDLDWIKSIGNKHLILLCHGLEGSSQSKYMLGMAAYGAKHNYDVLALNFRSCSGEMNRLLPSYHHGKTDDLEYVINWILQHHEYESIQLMGFSLGGNVIIKYLGTSNVNARVKSAVAVSVPSDLASSSSALDKKANYLYTKNFRRLLKPKLTAKSEMFPGVYDMNKFDQVKTWWEFDTTFTSKIFGFKDADEYYSQGSANFFIPTVQIPLLMINALNDPFLGQASYPYHLEKSNSFFKLLTPKRGGHVGFIQSNKKTTWVEEVGLKYFDYNLSKNGK